MIELKYPIYLADNRNINIIKPLYDKLKYGEKVRFIIESNLNSLIIVDDDKCYNLEKNEQRLFEKEITIHSIPGNNVIIKEKKLFFDSNLVLFKVIV